MIQAAQTDPAAYAAVGTEIAVALCGLWLLWVYVLSPNAPKAERRLPEWQLPPVDFACYAFCAIVSYLLLSSLAGLALRFVPLKADAAAVLGGAVQDVGLLVGIFGFHRFYTRGARSANARSVIPSAIKSGAITFFIAMALVDLTEIAWGYALTKLGLPMENQEMVDVLQNAKSPWVKGSLMGIAVILAPITEEIVFRGGLFRYFRTRIPRWLAIGLTSALFGALHVTWGNLSGLPSFAPLAVLAAVFCLAYERTGLISTTIVAHAMFNTFTFLLVVMGLHA